MYTKNIPQQEYYYLQFGRPQGVNLASLQRDINRGVRQLTESAYTISYGSTRGSLNFCLAIIQLFGYDKAKALKAQLTFSETHHFKLRVYMVTGHEVVFEGVSGGYWGEGTRGCHDILKVFGFNKKQCSYPFKKETFTCYIRK